MESAPASRAFSLAWLMGLAFSHNRAAAIVAFPVALMTIVACMLRRGVYATRDRNGMVILVRWSPLADIIAACVIITLTYVAIGVVAAVAFLAWVPLGLIIVGTSVLWILAGAVIFASGAQTLSPVCEATPEGLGRWHVSALAQRPGTRLSALLLLRQLVGAVPPGHVLVASAGSDDLLNSYVRLGFTSGSKRRVFKILG